MIRLMIGNISFHIESYKEFSLDRELQRYICDDVPGNCRTVFVEVEKMTKDMVMPGEFRGKDGLMEYYRDGSRLYSRDIPARDGSACFVEYNQEMDHIVMYINDDVFPNAFSSLNKVLQMLPIREILMENHSLLLHSSQVCIPGDKLGSSIGNSIIFTASSGTGKTTQAKLWEKYEGAERISNDRTLFFYENDTLYTSGYFVDGSEPVYSNKHVLPAAIVCLAQSPVNHIERLKASKALSLLMSQTVADEWNMDVRAELQLMWIEILKKVPVYMLSCTPDQEAVNCLKNRLICDGVLVWRDGNEID